MESKEVATPAVIQQDLIAEGKWLKLMKFTYTDEQKKPRIWETLVRTTHGRAEVDAVEIVPILKRKGQTPCLVVIKQFRPPPNQYIIELPAGLVDSNEPVQTAALRELKEETGYTGSVVDESISLLFGMAISNTTIKIVSVEIDGDLPENQNPVQHLEEGEYAEVILIPINKIFEKCNEYLKAGCGIDGKLWMLGYGLQTLPKLLAQK